MDFAEKIEALREVRETTPHGASVPGLPANKMASRHATVKKAKEHNFPSTPADYVLSQRMSAVSHGRKAVLAGGAAGKSPENARISERMSAVSRGIKAPKA